MNPTQTALALALQAGVPALIWGPPGIGKSAVMRAIAEALDKPIEVVIASVREPSDFAGLPVIRPTGVEMAPPAWARRLAEHGGIAFFDEISTAAPATQAALLRVVLDRVVGDCSLPETVSIAAAANPPDQAAGGWELSMPLANRFWHGTWDIDAVSWAQGVIAGWPKITVPRLPRDWQDNLALSSSMVAAFMRHRPTLLLKLPKADDAGRAWPSPRSWSMAARMFAACEAAGFDQTSDVMAVSVGGCVGTGAAQEFFTWLKALDLPDPEKVLAKPESFKLPSRSDQQFAALSSIVSAVVHKVTKDRFQAAWKVLADVSENHPGARDVAVAMSVPLVKLFRSKPDATGALPPMKVLSKFLPILKAVGVATE